MTDKAGLRDKAVHLGDNCIQNFHLGRYIVGYTVENLVLRRRVSGDVKPDFRTYIRRYTSPNENWGGISTVGNLVLRRRVSGAVKRDFRTYIRRYTSPNENFEYGYPHSNALLTFPLQKDSENVLICAYTSSDASCIKPLASCIYSLVNQ